ncbi:RluA family pseudouridine synthase [Lactobacillus sp. Sy-1]|uniref:RluA family pseudouridine synthase n=1 Tax=Lactobacillus sp. Sy-1 TaxID=2109645 RepID=UPI001C55AD9F|nr:RluA family pseudouridine synthase [Lactobacillus sp. Sy-1]MBW1605403.1 RluA family pseudouridine synthase [Lactobacillus sp. Sy-1]
MTSFNWTYDGNGSKRVRTLLMEHGVTRTLLKKIKFHGGTILVNGTDQRANYMLDHGDVVELTLPPEPNNDSVPASFLPINVVYEDEHFLVVNKPPFLATVPNHNYAGNTLVNRVKGYYLKHHYANLKIHVVTRLDKDTSGLVIFAKHHLAHSVLDKQLKQHLIVKMYNAIVENRFDYNHGEIDLPIGRDEDSFVKRQVKDDGKPSKTEFWQLYSQAGLSLLRIKLHTGRTHQIRVHFAAIEHPLIGDWLYNPNNHEMKRQALHCYYLQFYNPFEKKSIICRAPLPDDMQNLIWQKL